MKKDFLFCEISFNTRKKNITGGLFMAEKRLDEKEASAFIIRKDWQAPVILEIDYSETKGGPGSGSDMESLQS